MSLNCLNRELIDKKISRMKEVFWINPEIEPVKNILNGLSLKLSDINDADKRLIRFSAYIKEVFPETLTGIIESPAVEIAAMKDYLEKRGRIEIPGKLYLKCDNALPVSGSIKARGGIYEVLKHAEDLAIKHGLFAEDGDYSILNSRKAKKFFSEYSIAVGSTGNLGLSIGIMGRTLGFNVDVHMSSDAKKWKKDLLRNKGVHVIEHKVDYSAAVEAGRKEAEKNPLCYFVDDENSADLFCGYAVAAIRLADQFKDLDIKVDKDHPLFVYLPCGIGGAPGGITFGLKHIFGDNVHCFFAEPVAAPAMLLGFVTGRHSDVSVSDYGVILKTEADGLAVGRPSGFVGKIMENLISGIFTVKDNILFSNLAALRDTERIKIEPSAAIGFEGIRGLLGTEEGSGYLSACNLDESIKNGTHLVWATGGDLVPDDIMTEYYKRGKESGD